MALIGNLPELLLLPVLAAICRQDLHERRIANGAVMLVLALGGVDLVASASDPATIAARAALMGALFVPLAALWHLGAIGGGDVKLMTAAMIWIAPDNAVTFLFITTATGAVMGIAMLLQRQYWHGKSTGDSAQVPYAIAICVGLVVTLLTGHCE